MVSSVQKTNDGRTMIIFQSTEKNIAFSTLLGCALWCLSSLYFGGYLPVVPAENIYAINLWQLIGVVVLYFGLWIGAAYIAEEYSSNAAFFLYLLAVGITGYMQGMVLTAVVDSGFDVQDAKFIFIFAILLAVIMMTIAIIIGMFFISREKAQQIYYIGAAMLISTIIFEIIVVFIFGVDWVYLITTPIIIIAILYGTTHTANKMFDKDSGDNWMVSVISLTLDFIVIVARIFSYIIKLKAR